ncbi:efflux pump antibiotic resistance protein [Mytilinidion resinicola]|uniref:Efflux pump antibiotic resistance protein n=1 Tax=Mytilinidion resinicola TaxID=574789 RepID=A0A6A6YDP6_9PEZI|nr:efflux pump antibiotic resistance protein [Mytilinidion resinicola]KAF2806678.1 efflux pump antibiotic resistance protein [Mytilinidion resinicola]
MFLVGIDASIIGVAIPRITASFRSLDDIAWYGSAYMLPCTVLQPSFGAFFKSFNVTYVYMASIILFEAGSVLCAAAPTSTAFILGRAVSGCGAAGIFQGALSIIGYTVEKKKIPLYYGYVVSVFGISTCTAPIFGGALTDHVSWRWCFWINLPIGCVVLVLVPMFIRVRLSNDALRKMPVLVRLRRIDWIGTVLFTGAFTCLFLALQWGGQIKPWKSPEVIGLIVGFALLLGVFVWTQKLMGERSLIPLRLLKQRTVLFGSMYLLLMYLALSVYLYYIPIYFQAIRGTSATNSGVRIIALDVSRVVFVVIAAALVTKWGHYMPFMVAGSGIGAIGAGLLTMLDVDTGTALSTIYMLIWGAGAGIGANQPFTALQAALSENDMPIGNGITVFALQLGSALAYAISQTMFLTEVFHLVETNPLTQNISRSAILAAGATNLGRLSTNPETVRVVRSAYISAIKDVMLVALVSVCLAHLALPGMEWLKIPVDKAGEQDEEMVAPIKEGNESRGN